jgi:hypothetical protein
MSGIASSLGAVITWMLKRSRRSCAWIGPWQEELPASEAPPERARVVVGEDRREFSSLLRDGALEQRVEVRRQHRGHGQLRERSMSRRRIARREELGEEVAVLALAEAAPAVLDDVVEISGLSQPRELFELAGIEEAVAFAGLDEVPDQLLPDGEASCRPVVNAATRG